MRITIFCLILSIFLVAADAQSQSASNEVLVKFKPGTAAQSRASAHQAANAQVTKVLSRLGVVEVEVQVGAVQAAVAIYSRNPNVEYAEPNHRRLLFRPVTTEGSEPSLGISNNFEEQWGLNNTGQAFGATVDPLFGTLIVPAFQGSAGADINAPEGWGVDRRGSASVAVAVLDSGVDCGHRDLIGKCIEELNFVAEHGSDLADLIGHGTHVAGITAANTDNGAGIAGVGWNTSIGSLKVCWEDMTYILFGIIIGQCDDGDVAEAISYATTSGLYQVINMSLAGPEFSITLQNAVDDAWNAGIVIVAGAGNEYTTDVMYPAGYANVIAVGSTDQHDNLSAFSTFGNWVSVLAPGTTILSTVPGAACNQPAGEQSDCYDWKSGTSMSTPHVSGLAALLWAHLPSPTNADVRNVIENTADTVGAMQQNLTSWAQYGRINMSAALTSGGVEATAHHVESIVATTVNAGKGKKYGQVQVSVIDDLGNPVSGASVSGTFTGTFNEAADEVTDATGVATLSTVATAKGGVSFTFCVDDVVSATTYDASANSTTCENL